VIELDYEAIKRKKQVTKIIVLLSLAFLILVATVVIPTIKNTVKARGVPSEEQQRVAARQATGVTPPAPAPAAPAAAPAAGPTTGPTVAATPPGPGIGPATPGGAPTAGLQPTGPLAQQSSEVKPLLPSRSDPFGLGAAISPTARSLARKLLPPPIFSPGTWGLAERGAGLAVAGAPGQRRTNLVEVTIPSLSVSPSPVPPLPSATTQVGRQSASLPTDVAQLVSSPAGVPALPSSPMEGMRLSGIVRTGTPRAILEWRTPQGNTGTQVVAPNNPLVWPEGSRVEQIGKDYAIIRDAQGNTWRVPLRS
jgi:hypothetical protein